ncbi:MAG: class I SAM-dependent methyltransferase [Candidatus Uhrbacteria bacterium]
MTMTLREKLLLWWGRRHIGETIRRRAVRRSLCKYTPTNSPSRTAADSEARRRGGPDVILDAGCGRGDNALWCARRWPSARIDAVDFDPECIATVERRAVVNYPNVHARIGNIERDTFGSGYDIIYSVDVFEHLHNPHTAFERCAAQLERGGRLIIHVPQREQRRWFSRFEQFDQEDHVRSGFTREELEQCAAGVGLRAIEARETFGRLGALGWELFQLAQQAGKWFALVMYPVPWILATLDGVLPHRSGNGLLVVFERTP